MGSSGTIKSLERGLRVLRALHECPISSLHDLHEQTRISKPALLRILLTLQQSGMVSRRLADGRYRISANLSHLVRKRDRYDIVAEAAAPVLDRLCQQVSWPSDLMVPSGDHLEIQEIKSYKDAVPFFFSERSGRHSGELGTVGGWAGLSRLLRRRRASKDHFGAAKVR